MLIRSLEASDSSALTGCRVVGDCCGTWCVVGKGTNKLVLLHNNLPLVLKTVLPSSTRLTTFLNSHVCGSN